jgi:hypothetical protein
MSFNPGENFQLRSPTMVPEMLESEVTPGLLARAEPDAHQFYVTIVLMGDQMGRDLGRYHSNSRTKSGMQGTKEVLI